MPRRTIIVLAVFISALVVVNIVVLALWLPSRRSNNTANAPSSAPANPSSSSSAPAVVASRNAPAKLPLEASTKDAANFTIERQVPTKSGNLRVKYMRNAKTKMRRIVVEDAQRPGTGTILSESQKPGWALFSPNEQWIAVDDRGAGDGNGIRLYHRAADGSIVAADTGGKNLQEDVWRIYLDATGQDSNTPRRAVTLDAMGWDENSQKLDISVSYMPTAANPDVPPPWLCTYDVASKELEPKLDQAGEDNPAENAAQPVANSPASGPGPEQPAGNATAYVAGTTEEQQGEESADEFPGEKFPATRMDELTEADVNESSLSDITYAINEMYARHGAAFKDAKVTHQFAQLSWYQARPGVSLDEIKKDFSDLEQQNLSVLEHCRDQKIAASRHVSRPARGEREETTGEKVLRGIRAWQDMGGPMPPHP